MAETIQLFSASETEQRRAKPLEGQVILVTGGSRGIGRAIVEEVSRQGASVCFTYAHTTALAEELAHRLTAEGRQASAMQADVRDFGRARDVVVETLERFGRLDGLVNNAGIVQDKALMLMDPGDWRDVIETNLTGVFNYCRAAIVTFMKQRAGRIVNITSVSGLAGMARQVNYSASKAGMIGLTKALAREVAGYGIRVNAVAPGYIETDMTNSLGEQQRGEAQKRIPLGRFGRPEEVSQVVAMLLSDASSYITGQVVAVEGGLLM
jgi:3-oxoacyl-[acyl-carrier protein] reductase